MAHGCSLEFAVEESRSDAYQAAYGRLFPKMKAWAPPIPPNHDLDSYLLDIANRRMVEAPDERPMEVAANTRRRAAQEEQFGSTIPAGYTYFGQFVDHDITFDPASQLMRRNDPKGVRNFRTPRLDLDSVYGRGPEDQPYLYDRSAGQAGRMLIGQVKESGFRDLPRNDQGRALIGDSRNDENAIVSQLHLAFLLAHNTLVERAELERMDNPFEAARKRLLWLYQYVVWKDFLHRVTDLEIHRRALQPASAGTEGRRWVLGLEQLYSWQRQPFIPVEFSAAAYRFGHSMVRNEYQTNERRGLDQFVPLFDRDGGDDLLGRRPMRPDNVIQWSWLLKMGLPRARHRFPQRARKIDTKLVDALARVPVGDGHSNVLAYRNLKRGWSFGLPAGSAVAESLRALDIAPLQLEPGEPDALWYYILREAEAAPDAGNRLGPVGSAIVCAVFASLLASDPDSFINCKTPWNPNDDRLLVPGEDNIDGVKAREEDADTERSWTLASIIRIAGLPIDGQDIDDASVGKHRVPGRRPPLQTQG